MASTLDDMVSHSSNVIKVALGDHSLVRFGGTGTAPFQSEEGFIGPNPEGIIDWKTERPLFYLINFEGYRGIAQTSDFFDPREKIPVISETELWRVPSHLTGKEAYVAFEAGFRAQIKHSELMGGDQIKDAFKQITDPSQTFATFALNDSGRSRLELYWGDDHYDLFRQAYDAHKQPRTVVPMRDHSEQTIGDITINMKTGMGVWKDAEVFLIGGSDGGSTTRTVQMTHPGKGIYLKNPRYGIGRPVALMLVAKEHFESEETYQVGLLSVGDNQLVDAHGNPINRFEDSALREKFGDHYGHLGYDNPTFRNLNDRQKYFDTLKHYLARLLSQPSVEEKRMSGDTEYRGTDQFTSRDGVWSAISPLELGIERGITKTEVRLPRTHERIVIELGPDALARAERAYSVGPGVRTESNNVIDWNAMAGKFGRGQNP